MHIYIYMYIYRHTYTYTYIIYIYIHTHIYCFTVLLNHIYTSYIHHGFDPFTKRFSLG